MYASVFSKVTGLLPILKEVAAQFSPISEEVDAQTIVFDVAGNAHLIGTPDEIATAVFSTATRQGLSTINVAIARYPDTAVCCAWFIDGITVIPSGQESEHLAAIPIAALESSLYKVKNTPLWIEGLEIIETLRRWGIRSFGEFTALPEDSIAPRLGTEGLQLYRFAQGTIKRPLVVARNAAPFQQSIELEYPVELLDHLSFILRRMIADLCNEASDVGLAIQILNLSLGLEDKSEFNRPLLLPFPTTDEKTLYNLLTLAISTESFDSAIVSLSLSADPVKQRTIQGGLFEKATPAPEKLHLTLSRIEAIIGSENLGYPTILNTHRPDAVTLNKFQVIRKPLPNRSAESHLSEDQKTISKLLFGFRVYRPALQIAVRTRSDTPVSIRVKQSGDRKTINGNIVKVTGPWRTTGDWWEPNPWLRDEWDVSLNDGGVYRIYQDLDTREWFIEGAYD